MIVKIGLFLILLIAASTAALANPFKKVHSIIDINGLKIQPNFVEASVEAIGMPQGEYANPNYKHVLVLKTADGIEVRIRFQNNIPNLEGQAISFQNSALPGGFYDQPISVSIRRIIPCEEVTGCFKPKMADPYPKHPIQAETEIVENGSVNIEHIEIGTKGLLTAFIGSITFSSKTTGQTYEGFLDMNFKSGEIGFGQPLMPCKQALSN